jgi:hypothetical protein
VFPNAPGRTNAAGIGYDDMVAFGLTARLSVPLGNPAQMLP